MTQIEIIRLGHQGDGIAEGPVFAAKTLPGECVEGELDGNRLISPRILTASADRVTAPCTHFKACGGCSLQHASDEFVSNWKAEIVHTALANHGISIPVPEVFTSPAQSRRRAVFSGRRTKKDVLVGLHGRASGSVVPIPECTLMTSEIVAAIPALEDLVRMGGSRRGEVPMTVIHTDAGLDVSVADAKPLDLTLRTGLAAVVRKHGLVRLSWNGEEIVQETRPYLTFGRARLVPPPGAFLQATKHGEATLVALMREAVLGSGRVVDLFSGCGTFALPLSEDMEVHAVEGEAEMLDSLDVAWRGAAGLKVVTTEARDLFRQPLLPDELARYDAAVIDPPRAGALAQTTELAKSKVNVVGFISCNPLTFARDAKILLENGFEIDWLKVVDQFRWSPHIEIAARFYRT